MVVTIDLFCYEYIMFLKCHIALHVISILMKQASGMVLTYTQTKQDRLLDKSFEIKWMNFEFVSLPQLYSEFQIKW